MGMRTNGFLIANDVLLENIHYFCTNLNDGKNPPAASGELPDDPAALKAMVDSGKYGKVVAADFSRSTPPPDGRYRSSQY